MSSYFAVYSLTHAVAPATHSLIRCSHIPMEISCMWKKIDWFSSGCLMVFFLLVVFFVSFFHFFCVVHFWSIWRWWLSLMCTHTHTLSRSVEIDISRHAFSKFTYALNLRGTEVHNCANQTNSRRDMYPIHFVCCCCCCRRFLFFFFNFILFVFSFCHCDRFILILFVPWLLLFHFHLVYGTFKPKINNSKKKKRSSSRSMAHIGEAKAKLARNQSRRINEWIQSKYMCIYRKVHSLSLAHSFSSLGSSSFCGRAGGCARARARSLARSRCYRHGRRHRYFTNQNSQYAMRPEK